MYRNKLTWEFVPPGFDVITFGEFGDKFYITLSGNVGVLIPLPHQEHDENEDTEDAIIEKEKRITANK